MSTESGCVGYVVTEGLGAFKVLAANYSNSAKGTQLIIGFHKLGEGCFYCLNLKEITQLKGAPIASTFNETAGIEDDQNFDNVNDFVEKIISKQRREIVNFEDDQNFDNVNDFVEKIISKQRREIVNFVTEIEALGYRDSNVKLLQNETRVLYMTEFELKSYIKGLSVEAQALIERDVMKMEKPQAYEAWGSW